MRIYLNSVVFILGLMCTTITAVGVLFLLDYPYSGQFVTEVIPYPLSCPASTVEGAKECLLKNVAKGQDFYISREICTSNDKIFSVKIIRYLESKSDGAIIRAIPLHETSLLPRAGCRAYVTHLQIPYDVSPGNYEIRTTIAYRNLVGLIKLLELEPIPIEVI